MLPYGKPEAFHEFQLRHMQSYAEPRICVGMPLTLYHYVAKSKSAMCPEASLDELK